MLNEIGYTGVDILGKSILEPSCGDGRFLIEIVKRIIHFSPPQDLKNNLKCVYGWDIDEDAIVKCIENLNLLISFEMDWNIVVCDSLKNKEIFLKFDFIIGNPPYIKIANLEKIESDYIKANFIFCKKGLSDVYVAFYELCDNLLSENGICSLITPNTILYSNSCKDIRKSFSDKKKLIKITNYNSLQVFKGISTYNCITTFNKKENNNFIYEFANSLTEFVNRTIPFEEIENNWNISNQPTTQESGIPLKDFCKIYTGIQSSCDKVYILKFSKFLEGNLIELIDYNKSKIVLEIKSVKPIIKVSKMKNNLEPIKEYIIFPYTNIKNKNVIISEENFKETYPLCYQYLFSHKTKLLERNLKPFEIWYALGRSQGLDTTFGKKIVFARISFKPNFILIENEESTFYQGYCIKCSKDEDYKHLLEKLNSKEFENFASYSCKDLSGGYKIYDKKIIQEFIL